MLTETRRLKAMANPLAMNFINERIIWRDRWTPEPISSVKTLVDRAVALAELQALTKDATGEFVLLEYCKAIAVAWPGDLTPESIFADNPEPFAVRLARIAARRSSAPRRRWRRRRPPIRSSAPRR